MNTSIPELISDLCMGANEQAYTTALSAIPGHERAAWMPPLLELIGQEDATARRAGFFALQHCWSASAREAVISRLGSADPDTRRMAAIVLERGEGRAFLAQAAARWLDDSDPARAGEALALVDSMYPDVERLRRALDRTTLRPYLLQTLSRYHDPSLVRFLLTWLEDQDTGVARAGLVALIQQVGPPSSVHARLRELLSHRWPEARELAAEYFCRHGSGDDRPLLQAALAVETDHHAAASLRLSLQAMEKRSTTTAQRRTPQQNLPTPTHESRWYYQGRAPAGDFLRGRQTRFDLQTTCYGWPARAVRASRRDLSGDAPAPYGGTLIAPIRHYSGTANDSYGVDTDKANRTYTELVHVGEDVGWDDEAQTVVAIADGVIREVSWLESWGNIVVVEHHLAAVINDELRRRLDLFTPAVQEPVRIADGSFRCCSVYAHLGAGIWRVPGQPVLAGEKIGVIGRPYTWENGGYRAHLHFAVHLGSYWQTPRVGSRIDLRFEGRRYEGVVRHANRSQIAAIIHIRGRPKQVVREVHWLCGYVSPSHFESGAHGWINPRLLFS